MKLKTAQQVLDESIPVKIANEGYSFGDIPQSVILKAMEAYAAQFTELHRYLKRKK